MGERKFDGSVFAHPTAVSTGNVRVGRGSSLWPHCALRGDFDSIAVGEFTSIQTATQVEAPLLCRDCEARRLYACVELLI